MTNLLEIEAAIQQLPEQEVRQLVAWLQAYLDEKWERQLEPDLASGKLDRLIAKAEADIALAHSGQVAVSAFPCEEFPLAGKVTHYEDPFGPATTTEDWDVLQ